MRNTSRTRTGEGIRKKEREAAEQERTLDNEELHDDENEDNESGTAALATVRGAATLLQMVVLRNERAELQARVAALHSRGTCGAIRTLLFFHCVSYTSS